MASDSSSPLEVAGEPGSSLAWRALPGGAAGRTSAALPPLGGKACRERKGRPGACEGRPSGRFSFPKPTYARSFGRATSTGKPGIGCLSKEPVPSQGLPFLLRSHIQARPSPSPKKTRMGPLPPHRPRGPQPPRPGPSLRERRSPARAQSPGALPGRDRSAEAVPASPALGAPGRRWLRRLRGSRFHEAGPAEARSSLRRGRWTLPPGGRGAGGAAPPRESPPGRPRCPLTTAGPASPRPASRQHFRPPRRPSTRPASPRKAAPQPRSSAPSPAGSRDASRAGAPAGKPTRRPVTPGDPAIPAGAGGGCCPNSRLSSPGSPWRCEGAPA